MASCARRYYGASKEVKFDDVVAFTYRETRIAVLRKDLGELENGYGLAREHRQPRSKVSPLIIWMMTLVPIQNRTCTLMSTPPTKGLPSHRSAARAPSVT